MFVQGFTAHKVLLHILAYLFFVFQTEPWDGGDNELVALYRP